MSDRNTVHRRLLVLLVIGLLVIPCGRATATVGPEHLEVPSQGEVALVQSAPDESTTTEFTLEEGDESLDAGENGTVDGVLTNSGSEPAFDVVLVLSPDQSEVSPRQPEIPLGDLQPGDSTEFKYPIAVPDDAESGDRQLSFVVEYRSEDGTAQRSDALTGRVTVAGQGPDFEIVDGESELVAGEEGTVLITIENEGEDVSDAIVTLQSRSSELRLGKAESDSRFVGEWETGDEQTVEYRVVTTEDALEQSYPLQVTVSYEAENGTSDRSDPLPIGVTPEGEQGFSLSNLSGGLSVGDEGAVAGTITNDGPQTASDAVVTFEPETGNLDAQETEYALGTLEPGESAPFSFPIEVSDTAEPGDRQLSFIVEYENEQGDLRRSDPLNVQVTVDERTDEFLVESQHGTVQSGDSEAVTVVVTNNGAEPVRNVDARAFADDPLTLSNDEAFVAELEPDESAALTFEVSAASGAVPNTYPLSLDFQYDEEDGETKLSDTYEVPITVTEPEGDGLPLGPIGGVALSLLFAVAVAWLWRRR
ncbi:COG1361 S-layer family protein [Halegenticoccus tardaugens]|uniref:COG1361 S-layer family protein n=1 Tax=Halegenticoccus tardaugens TaxID=2071624 RepID=UPI0013E92194|nr:COG1361 S-layer family protein [Halegenticoccus tardaugens]